MLLEQVKKILLYVGCVARNDSTEAISEFTENVNRIINFIKLKII